MSEVLDDLFWRDGRGYRCEAHDICERRDQEKKYGSCNRTMQPAPTSKVNLSLFMYYDVWPMDTIFA
jgi:hypothetical protein